MWSLILLGVRLDAGPVQRDRACRLTGVLVILLQWRPDDAQEHRVQTGATSSSPWRWRSSVSIRCCRWKRPKIPRPVVCRLHLRLRRCLPHTAIDLGACCRGPLMQLDAMNLLTLFYVAGVSLDTGLSVLQSRRAVDRRQPRRGRFFHVVPVFGSAMAIVFSSAERPPAVPHHRLRAGC